MSILNVIGEVGYHGAVGAFVAFLVCYKQVSRRKDMWILMFFGFLAGLIPDLLTVLLGGDIYFWAHSLFVVPSLTLGLAMMSRIFITGIRFSRQWMALFLSLIIGHLVMDTLDNGAPWLYPIFESRGTGFYLFSGNDLFLAIPFLIFIALLIFFHPKQRKLQLSVLILGLTLMIFTLGFKGYSKMEVYQALVEEYPDFEIVVEPLNVTPFQTKQWTFVAESKFLSIEGEASFSKVKEIKRSVQTNEGLMLLLKEVKIENEIYYICKPYIFDENYLPNKNIPESELVVFLVDESSRQSELLDKGKKDEILSQLPQVEQELILYEAF
ncbi:metal-dependent hydrolase [Bacillus spongiae]|uniref:Metal-dependent hydrolase n=1 Tax=Bacillus spongiae TaxID=2683610 RepID=A0ABU8HHV3_9BACI